MRLSEELAVSMGIIATGALKDPDMNGTERRYAQLLDLRQKAGEVIWWKYEGMTLKLADDTRYTPDFALMLRSGAIECHEIKGFLRDDALVKIKVAAAQFPFKFRMFSWKQRQWVEREF